MGATPIQTNFPLVDTHKAWAKEPIKILDRRMMKRGNMAITKVLVEWANSFPGDATWESFQQLKGTFPHIDP